jgi:hypothetical protein
MAAKMLLRLEGKEGGSRANRRCWPAVDAWQTRGFLGYHPRPAPYQDEPFHVCGLFFHQQPEKAGALVMVEENISLPVCIATDQIACV